MQGCKIGGEKTCSLAPLHHICLVSQDSESVEQSRLHRSRSAVAVQPSDGWFIPPCYWRWVASRRFILVMLWLVCLAYAGQRLYRARTEFDNRPDKSVEKYRADGNAGHTQ